MLGYPLFLDILRLHDISLEFPETAIDRKRMQGDVDGDLPVLRADAIHDPGPAAKIDRLRYRLPYKVGRLQAERLVSVERLALVQFIGDPHNEAGPLGRIPAGYSQPCGQARDKLRPVRFQCQIGYGSVAHPDFSQSMTSDK